MVLDTANDSSFGDQSKGQDVANDKQICREENTYKVEMEATQEKHDFSLRRNLFTRRRNLQQRRLRCK
ncbi:hypothetical protein PanWU01x14_306830 [Parasponia andersonii]|uniref:Uncharacterized protein n=1 Tax=Parasponia andersonii TaxID=3476 RepID=A0A2P5ARJ9_PARAD|nr:hypothetical protein PanWU01x14_306830 [Parasponia andersonii]